MDDLEFVQRCVKGDKHAWDTFIEKYSRLIYNYIHSVLKLKGSSFSQDNINDIFQDIILSLFKDNFRKLSTFKAKNGCSLASWLRQVTINFTVDYLRRLKTAISIDEQDEEGFSLADLLASGGPSAKDSLKQKDILASLSECIDGLSRQEQLFLELHVNQGLGLEKLKQYFQLSRGAIDMRKSRIIERLKDCFRKKGFIF